MPHYKGLEVSTVCVKEPIKNALYTAAEPKMEVDNDTERTHHNHAGTAKTNRMSDRYLLDERHSQRRYIRWYGKVSIWTL